jgi:hypothetical protein
MNQDDTNAEQTSKKIRELTKQRDELLAVVVKASEQIRKCDYTPARSTLLVAINSVEGASVKKLDFKKVGPRKASYLPDSPTHAELVSLLAEKQEEIHRLKGEPVDKPDERATRMNQGDIKLGIDLLEGLDLVNDYDAHIKNNAINLLETLGNKVAQQAAVIERLLYAIENHNGNYKLTKAESVELASVVDKAKSTDSKQILADWMREQLGEPSCWMWEFKHDDGASFSTKEPALSIRDGVDYQPLYKLPECLK